MPPRNRLPLLVLAAALALPGCGSLLKDLGLEKEAEPVLETLPAGPASYKVGKPYQVGGVWYYPAEDYGYDETGIASWYGPGFHAKYTANGEVYDQNQLTAAHRTLPMPSLVRVTNLDNGRSIVVRVNDRGPFAHGRIIDLSRRAAQLLGFEEKGTAKVRVQILADESRAIAAAARGIPGPGPDGTDPDADAPTVVAVPAAVVQEVGAPPPAVVAEAPAEPRGETVETLPGETVDGRFLPSPVVSVEPVSGDRHIFVQAGSFTLYENAHQLRGKLRRFGPIDVSEAVVGNQRFFRVRVGPLDTVERADSVLSALVDAGYNGARVVVD